MTHALDRLLTALYAAPARPEMWDVFLKEFGTVSGVNKAALIAHDFLRTTTGYLARWVTLSTTEKTFAATRRSTASSTNGPCVSPEGGPVKGLFRGGIYGPERIA